MSLSDYSRESFIPSLLYSAASPSKKLFDLEHIVSNQNHTFQISSSSLPVSRSSSMKSFVIPAPSEPGKIEMYSPAYFAACASSGMLSTGLTHTAVTPLDVVKCNMQTCLSDGLPKFVKSEGALGLYKGLVPLWGRQIPYTMMKFASFETIVELMYKHAIPTPKEECSKTFQLGLSFVRGDIAGIFCAIVSHPADKLVSFLNNAEGATVRDAVNKLGVWGLFTRGLPLRIVMIGTLTGA